MRILPFVLLAWALPALGADPDRGRLLYETHCATCHTERLHHRDKSKIRSVEALRAEVRRWAPQTKYRFTPEEIEDVVEYLDASHYRLSAAPARELIYGAELMTPAEREQYRREAAAARSEAAGNRLRERHRQRIRERARERGVTLAEPAGIVSK